MVVAQAFKVAAEAALPLAAQLQVDLPGAREKERLVLLGGDRGVDADGLDEVGDGPALGERERAAVAQVEPAAGVVAAFAGGERVADRGPGAREGFKRDRRRSRHEGRGQVVEQRAGEDGFADL